MRKYSEFLSVMVDMSNDRYNVRREICVYVTSPKESPPFL